MTDWDVIDWDVIESISPGNWDLPQQGQIRYLINRSNQVNHYKYGTIKNVRIKFCFEYDDAKWTPIGIKTSECNIIGVISMQSKSDQ